MDEYSEGKIVSEYHDKNGDRVWVLYPDGKRRTLRKSRYVLENKLHRYLKPTEMVRYRDKDKTNLDPDNLYTVERYVYKKKTYKCAVCGKEFVRKVREDEPEDNSPKYCSRWCMRKTEQHYVSSYSFNMKCPTCGKEFVLTGRKFLEYVRNRKIKPDMVGPFCSQKCKSAFMSFPKDKKAALRAESKEIFENVMKEINSNQDKMAQTVDK